MGKRKGKSRPLKRPSTVKPSDLGTDELAAHYRGGTEISLTHDNKRRRRVFIQTPIDAYRHINRNRPGGGINQRQWEAGNRLFECYEATGLFPSPKPLWERIPISGGSMYHGERVTAALIEWRKTIQAMGPNDLGMQLLFNVCCLRYKLNELDAPFYPNSSHLMSRFREALNKLADHYHIPYYPER